VGSEMDAKDGSSEKMASTAPPAACPMSKVRKSVSDYSLLDTDVQDQPFEFYQVLHRECPVYQMPETNFYIISRYEDARRVARDNATFLNQIPARQGLAGERDAIYQSVLRQRGWPNVPTLQRCDGEQHSRHRKLVERVFTPARVREITPRLEQLAHQIIDRFIDRGECEFVSEFALMLPGMFISEQLGLDAGDVSMLKRWGDAIVAMRSRLLSEAEVRATAEIELECQHHLAQIIEARRTTPANDILSGLVHSHDEGEEPLSMGELQGLGAQLIAAGFETTMGAISHGMMFLQLFPDQMAKLRADRSLTKNFVEEVLRYDAPVHGILRLTTDEVEIAGTTIPKGSIVMPRFGAANRDAKKYPDPDTFDITRANASTHMSFGFGPHFCIGAVLAKQEMITGFSAVFDRMDDIRLASPLPSPAHRPDFWLRPLKELRLAFRKEV
jgi:cytochrome P450